ncbi:hypothetical protein, partial [Pseudomonas sp. QD5]|uniref:hypothetical protein n=3 Tax=unclassified Pseudomonas TaxID=196821 RepID=UPI003BA208EC
ANAVDQLRITRLTHRFREQARSHIEYAPAIQNLFDSTAIQQVRIAGTQTAWSVCASSFLLMEYCL